MRALPIVVAAVLHLGACETKPDVPPPGPTAFSVSGEFGAQAGDKTVPAESLAELNTRREQLFRGVLETKGIDPKIVSVLLGKAPDNGLKIQVTVGGSQAERTVPFASNSAELITNAQHTFGSAVDDALKK